MSSLSIKPILKAIRTVLANNSYENIKKLAGLAGLTLKEQPKDYTPLLNGIINGDVSVFDDKAKLTELVGAAQELGGDDMPYENKGLFIEAITAAGIQQLEGDGFL